MGIKYESSCALAALLLLYLCLLGRSLKPSIVVGLNKYSHDASCCLIDANSGKILFSQAKERITRRKHDGGGVGSLLRYALRSVGASVEDIACVVSNNHHYRVLPFERKVPYYSALNYIPQDFSDVDNLLAGKKQIELSHHLAHAWGAAGTAPFSEGLVVVMDGMGETFRAMSEDAAGIETESGEYMHDLKLLKKNSEGFVGVPKSLFPYSGYREAESAYVFDGSSLKPVFKRWTRQRSPPELYNGGFEDMESMGAVYSRISSHILGDWNACGKVMGLASWASMHRNQAKGWLFSNQNIENLGLGSDFFHTDQYMVGNPFEEESFKVNWGIIEKLGPPNRYSEEKFGLYANIARSMQLNLEACAISLVSSLQKSTAKENIVLTGGVALNSVLNGRIAREMGFKNVYIPPGPGDEGIAVGCALYGFYSLKNNDSSLEKSTFFPRTSFSAYQGREFSEEEIDEAINYFLPWITAVEFENEEELINKAIDVLADPKEGVLAWFQGRSEFGQRALGSRSFLADPRREELRIQINEFIKEREWYRPLAPSCLAEDAGEWFDDLKNGGNESPYMSITTGVKKDKQSIVPAICHIDGSARLQTVTEADNPLYHRLIKAFKKRTGVSMVLNTSFNRKSEPIVETPSDAIKSFLRCKGSVNALFLGNWEIRLRPFPLSTEMDSPSDSESKMFIYGEPFYMSEQTSSVLSPDSPLRIRVQCGGGEDENSDGEWKTLPSVLHLDILQLIQVEGDDSGDLVVADLVDVVSQMREGDVSWKDIRLVLKWLYENNLVHFLNGGVGSEIEAAELETLFKGANIVDLR